MNGNDFFHGTAVGPTAKKMFLKLKDFQLDIPVSVFVSDLIFFFFNFTSMPIEGHTTD